MDSGVGEKRKHGEEINEKLPVLLQNEDDRGTFEVIKNKLEYSKKHRQTLKMAKDEVKPEKQSRSGLSQETQDL